jgi:hypothetical protein
MEDNNYTNLEIEKELNVLGKIDELWAKQKKENYNAELLNKIHRIVCRRFNELKQKLKEEGKNNGKTKK